MYHAILLSVSLAATPAPAAIPAQVPTLSIAQVPLKKSSDLLTATPKEIASQPMTIEGQPEVAAYRIGRFRVQDLAAGAICLWDVSPDQHVDSEERGGELLLTAPPGEYFVKVRVLTPIDGGFRQNVARIRTRFLPPSVRLVEERSLQTPEPSRAISDFGLASLSRIGFRLVPGFADRKDEAARLAGVRRKVAAALASGHYRQDEAQGRERLAIAVMNDVRSANYGVVPNLKDWQPWASVVDTRTGTLYTLGRLTTAEQWRTVMIEIAQGLEE